MLCQKSQTSYNLEWIKYVGSIGHGYQFVFVFATTNYIKVLRVWQTDDDVWQVDKR